ncbi:MULTISPECIES: DUF3017 domain-containing protein [unclassified Streptomyces]|uniref:DUF3017 domain-containing protein n=1 Tax=unclassified Streptomyces TaxID=2593676 RepID=UPI00093969A3|nr:DUF3017 domain-containing protein [Streptomyces sp. TSRI0281]OKI47966.1 hypothetical protein A6A29_02580 [Streptomyces sp. TSRI0281]
MGAGTSQAEPTPARRESGASGEQGKPGEPGVATDDGAGDAVGDGADAVKSESSGGSGPGSGAEAGADAGADAASDAASDAGPEAASGAGAASDAGPEAEAEAVSGSSEADSISASDSGGAAPRKSRRFPSLTRDTARPEGGGRAAPGDAPAPARQWPLLTVLCTAGAGLLIVATDPFDQAFRIGTMLIGFALVAGAVLRWVVPSVGMLAVRSRFTDLVTYGLMGTLIVMLALMAQPKPWLDIPVLEDAVHFTIR